MQSTVKLATDTIRSTTGERFLARQPIVNRLRQPIGYELLYRGGRQAKAVIGDGDNASQDTLDSSLLIGLDVLCRNRLGFVNCSGEVLVGRDIFLLPPTRTVIEILEDVEPTAEILDACRKLRAAGFRIALDDFIPNTINRAFLPFVNILKVDMHSGSRTQREAVLREFSPSHVLLAEKVETEDEFTEALDAGFDLFQGYYLGRPEICSTRQATPGKVHALRLVDCAMEE